MAGAMVVDTGLAILTNRIIGSGTEPKYIHWGTGTTDPVAGNTALQTPRAEARVSGTSSRVQTNVSNDTYQVVGEITCAGSAASITEVGLFDASTNGNLFMRATFAAINVGVGDKIEFTIKTVFDQA
jgi:hypothetical protein